MRPTIIDVARMAQVSTATVSRVLHTPDRVVPATRAQVEEAIRQTGYTLNAAARMLRSRRSDTVLVVVPAIGNLFFSEILAGIERVASEAGLTILIGDTASDRVREEAYLRQMLNGHADGALLLARPLPGWAGGGEGAPVVTISEIEAGSPLAQVGIDNEAAAHAATLHLLGLGHARVAHLTGPPENILTPSRVAGYRRAMAEAGLAAVLVEGRFSADSGVAATAALMDRADPPTAVFCANDEMAMGLAHGLHLRGLSVPRDVSLVGFDDIELARTFIPALTTIRQPRRAMGEAAMRRLLAILAGDAGGAATEILDWALIERASAARPAQSA